MSAAEATGEQLADDWSRVQAMMNVVGNVQEVQRLYVDTAQYHAEGMRSMVDDTAAFASDLLGHDAALMTAATEAKEQSLSLAAEVATLKERQRAADQDRDAAVAECSSRLAAAFGTADLTTTALAASVSALNTSEEAKLATVAAADSAIREAASTATSARVQLHERQLEVTALRRDLAVANAQLDWERDAAAGSRSELLQLLGTVKDMGDRVEAFEKQTKDYARALARIELLEKRLPLDAVAEALLPENWEPIDPANPKGALLFPDAPDPKLKAAAPELYAMRLLAHRQVGLSELVESWLTSHDAITTLLGEKQLLEKELEAVNKNSHRVFLSMNHEIKRRRYAEQQLRDASRKYVTGDEALTQLNGLYVDLSKARDDHAAAVVSLQESRLEIARLQQEATSLQTRNSQLIEERSTVAFAQSVAALKVHHQREQERMSVKYSEAVEKSANMEAEITEIRNALSSHREMLKASKEANEQLAHRRSDATQRLVAAEKRIASLTEDVAKVSKERDLAKTAAAAAEQRGLRSANTAPKSVSSARVDAVASELTSLTGALQGIVDSAANASQPDFAAARVVDRSAFVRLSEAVLATYRYLRTQANASEELRSALIDRAIADASDLEALHRALHQATTERDALRDRVERCEVIIERHALNVSEAAAMRAIDVPAEVDVDAMREGQAALRADVAALEAARDSSDAALAASRSEVLRLKHALIKSERAVADATQQGGLWKGALDRRNEEMSILRNSLVAATRSTLDEAGDATTKTEGGEAQVAVDTESLLAITESLCVAAERLEVSRKEQLDAMAAQRRAAEAAGDESVPADVDEGEAADDATTARRIDRLGQINTVLGQIYDSIGLIRQGGDARPADANVAGGEENVHVTQLRNALEFEREATAKRTAEEAERSTALAKVEAELRQEVAETKTKNEELSRKLVESLTAMKELREQMQEQQRQQQPEQEGETAEAPVESSE